MTQERPAGPRQTLATLAKADLHLHQERLARLRQLAAQLGEQPHHDWSHWRRALEQLPPGVERLRALWDVGAGDDPRDDESGRLARFELTLLESAASGAVLTELRVGNELLLWPPVVATFREAERRVGAQCPWFHA